jgi:heterodisulfide reductase subunit B
MINNDFYKTLTRVNQILYKTSYEFHMKYHKDATPESAHAAGLEKLTNIEKLKEEFSKPQPYVNVATGETFYATESSMMAKHQF